MLTDRQRQVAELLARGMSYKRVGLELGISPRTVEEHVHLAARRLNPDTCRPRDTLALWFVRMDDEKEAA